MSAGENLQPSNTNDNLEAADLPVGSDLSDDDILKQARERYKLCHSADFENREQAKADLLFLTGGVNQWDPRAVAARQADGRPIITINQLPAFLHQVTNDQRMNTPSIHVHPVGSGADEETAKIRQGMIRHIEYDSNADIAYDRSVNSAAAVGMGYFYLDTEYETATGFDQKIMFKSIRNALSVSIDPLSTEPEASDMGYCFIESLMARSDFQLEYPDAEANDPTWFGDGFSDYSAWLLPETVLVCRYYSIEVTEADVVELSNGETGWKDKLLELPEGVTIKRTRKGQRKKVMLYKITGVDVLERTEIKMKGCAYIPVFAVYGDEVDVEGRVVRNGIIRHAKGPAQSYNVMMSGATEEVSLRTKAPYIGAVGAFEGMEDDWNQANNRAFPFLEYNPVVVDGVAAGAPQRQPMADIPNGMLAMAMHAADNVKKTTGLFDASLGQRGTATSGKQELAQQREGDVSNYHFADNLNRAVLHAGRVINAMIPCYYDGERVVQIMRPDDTMDSETINQAQPPQVDPMGQVIEEILNDMTAGEFSVTVSAGPAYSTMRQESQDFFTSAMQAAKDPGTAAIVTYLAMQNSDAPGAQEATKMLKTLLPPPAAAVIDDGEQAQMVMTPQGPIPAAQIPQILQQMQMQLQQQGEALQKAQADKQAEAAAKAQSEVMRQQNEAAALQLDAQRVEIERQQVANDQMKMENERAAAERQSMIDAEEQDTERLRISEETKRAENESEAENLRSVAAQSAEPAEKGPTIDEMAQLIIKSRPPLSGMQIKAPSGGVYDVTLQ